MSATTNDTGNVLPSEPPASVAAPPPSAIAQAVAAAVAPAASDEPSKAAPSLAVPNPTAAPPAASPTPQPVAAPAATPAAPAAAPAPAPPPPPPPKPEPDFVIPFDSTMRKNWDAAQFLITCFIGVVIPLRIGFNIVEWRVWAAFDIAVDLMLLGDIFMSCVTTFEQEGESVTDRSIIWWRYFRSFFFLDVLSVLPGEIIAAGLGFYTPLYRANRMFRFLRIGTYFSLMERDSSIKPTLIRLMKSAFSFLYFTHFIGCIYYIILRVEEMDAENDFIGQAESLIYTASLTSRYFRSWYWAMAVMPGFNNTNPTTLLELVFTMVVTLSGIMFFATIIGAVGDMATNLDSSKIYFRAKLDEIDDFMQYKKLPPALQDDVRAYYNYLWKSGKALENNDLLRDLPMYLKNKMSLYLNREIVSKVPMFKQYANDEKFIAALVMSLKSIVCLPNFFVVRKGEIGTDMYFVSRGELNVVSDEGAVLFTFTAGGFFGEIALLFDTKRTATIVSRTYCDMFILTKDDFKKVLRAFPEQSKGIKEIAKERFQKIVDDEKKKEANERAKRASEQDQAQAEAKIVAQVVQPGVEQQSSADQEGSGHTGVTTSGNQVLTPTRRVGTGVSFADDTPRAQAGHEPLLTNPTQRETSVSQHRQSSQASASEDREDSVNLVRPELPTFAIAMPQLPHAMDEDESPRPVSQQRNQRGAPLSSSTTS